MSHPAWVCGLKPVSKTSIIIRQKVTPCVGVWIETCSNASYSVYYKSHPAWVCGLKLSEFLRWVLLLCHTLRGCVD